ncbi:MAG: hypothetical protein QOI35_1112 [Cryptosporangiaceae bacterium]|nr:hypothetical protein [Cryptosporangiaceae bacterium]MDQ1651912.1 hypothetical protein [Cryptosporangiaceae bacterium]MDQ1655884.1 hypothetical protein [Cryptosporangiaceae bacterium]
MKALGTLTAFLLTALGAVAAVVAVRSLPDIRRYLKIRSM